MKIRTLAVTFVLLLGIGFCALAGQAGENKVKKVPTKKAKKAESDTAKVKTSKSFAGHWKRIRQLVRPRAPEMQGTRTSAGGEATEDEDSVLEQVYHRSTGRYLSKADLKNAISQLRETIKADSLAETIAEKNFLIAQCQLQLGEIEKARSVYRDLIENYPGTHWAKQAQKSPITPSLGAGDEKDGSP